MADKMDDKIRETMKEVEVPEVVDQAMENAFTKIRAMQNESQSKVTDMKTYKRRRWSARRMTAMVAVAALAVGGSVFAGVKLYQMHLQQEAAYSVSIGVESQQEATALELIEDVKAKVNVIPEGFEPYEKYENGYWNEGAEIGYYAQEVPYLIDTDENAVMNSVVDAESLTVNDHDALYIEERHAATKVGWYNGTLFILYPEYHRVEEIGAWGYTTKEDLLGFAEAVELISSGEQVDPSELPKWSEYVSWANENNEYHVDSIEAEQVFPNAVDKSELHMTVMNEKVDFETFAGERMEKVTLEASVTDYCVEASGTDTAYFVDRGDGKNSLDTVVKEEERELARATATLKITNTTDEDLENIYFYCPVLMLNEAGDQLTVDWLADGISDSIEYKNSFAESGEMESYTVNGEPMVKNYVSSLKAGETATIEISWIVDKAQADKLYMTLNGSPVLDEKTMKAPIIKLEK